MARGNWWECPICHTPNPPEMAVCVNTARHDADTESRYQRAIDGAAQILADVRAQLAAQTPEQAADAAYVPGGPSREEIAAKVRALRAQSRRVPRAA